MRGPSIKQELDTCQAMQASDICIASCDRVILVHNWRRSWVTLDRDHRVGKAGQLCRVCHALCVQLASESGYLGPSPILRRKAGFALPFVVFGAIASASGVVLQMADSTPTTDDRSSILRFLPATGSRPAPSSLTFPPRPSFLAVRTPFPLLPRARLVRARRDPCRQHRLAGTQC